MILAALDRLCASCREETQNGMGRRSATETITALLLAFVRERTWSQKDLSRALGVTVKALRRQLDELTEAGVPLERSEDHPQVYWSVPLGWLPGAVSFSAEQAESLMRLLARHARTADRDLLLDHIVRCLPRPSSAVASAPSIADGTRSHEIVPARAGMEPFLSLVEDATVAKSVLHIKYFTASRGILEWRHVSPARVLIGPPARLLAQCHRSRSLKWFRVDNIVAGTSARDVAFRPAARDSVEELIAASLDGFHGGDSPIDCRFLVRNPDARWVSANLPFGAVANSREDGILVEIRTAALLPLARFIVGLGGAVRVETPALAEIVRDLATAALGTSRTPVKSVSTRAKRKTG